MATKKILVFHPDIYLHHTSNEYSINIYKILTKHRDVRSFEWFLKHPFNMNVDTMFLNWYENTVGNTNSIITQYVAYALKYWILKFAKKRGIKIIFAYHNKTPHNITKESRLYETVIRPFILKYLKISDEIAIISKKTEQYLQAEYKEIELAEKISYIPHGTYKKYKVDLSTLAERYKISTTTPLFVMLGKMGKYKNTDIAIKAFTNADIDATLLLIGGCEKQYRDYLMELIGDNSSIISSFEAVSDEDYSGLMQLANAVILPYENTSLNSGVMINAFSNGTTVIGTNIEMLQDFPNDLVYGYNYKGREDHIKSLSEQMTKAYLEKEKLKEKGQKLEELINENNSWDQVEHAICEMLKEEVF